MKFIDFDNYLRASYSFATEEYITNNKDFKDEYFLIWRTNPTLMLGRFQAHVQEINTEFVSNKNIAVVRRNSGGGTIYTDLGCWLFTFIKHKKDGKETDFSNNIMPIIKAIQKMGIDIVFSGRNDILIDGKKFSGNARFESQNRTLYHGSILYDANIDDIIDSINIQAEKIVSKGISSIRDRVTNLRPHHKEDLDSLQFRDKLVSLIAKEMDTIQLSEADLVEIEKLEREKFLSWDWNYGKSPEFNFVKSKRFASGKVEVCLNVKAGIIESCKFQGDFFSPKEISELESQIKGKRYDKQELLSLFTKIDASSYFFEISNEELVSCFV